MALRRIPGLGAAATDRGTLIVAGAAAALLIALAVLQYRWTGELSAAANARMRANLEESSRLLAADIDEPLADLYTRLLHAVTLTDARRPPAGDAPAQFEAFLSRAVADWRENAPFPDILDETRVVLTDRRDGSLEVFRFDETEGRLRPDLDPGPADLGDIPRAGRPPRRGIPTHRTDRLVVLMPGRTLGGRRAAPAGVLVASLNASVLEEEMLPAAIERHFGTRGGDGQPEYIVSVTDLTGESPHRIYPPTGDSRARDDDAAPAAADIEFPVLQTPPFQGFPRGRGLREPRRLVREPRAPFRPGGPGREAGGISRRDSPGGAWLVRITHRRGSLAAATDAARRRNLFHSSGALSLLGIGFALVLVSARRARALAAQQVDFVAGVSHELNTPLQAIRSAGENLRAGVVREPEDVRGYGELIDREGRRLMRLVEQALHWAGIGQGSARTAAVEMDLSELLRTTVAESNWFVDENGVELEVDGLDDLPTVSGDRGALIRVFLNLLHNAVKYGRSADGIARVRVDASCDAGRQRVVVSVTDGGPGIPKAEQRRIFEPFVRGRAATESTLPGSGLGLSLVRSTIEEHGGSVAVDSEPGRTTFRVVLPANGP